MTATEQGTLIQISTQTDPATVALTDNVARVVVNPYGDVTVRDKDDHWCGIEQNSRLSYTHEGEPRSLNLPEAILADAERQGIPVERAEEKRNPSWADVRAALRSERDHAEFNDHRLDPESQGHPGYPVLVIRSSSITAIIDRFDTEAQA